MLEWWGPVLVSLRWQVRDFLFFFFFFCCCCLSIVGSRRQLWAGIGGCSIDNCGAMIMEFVLRIDWVEAKTKGRDYASSRIFFPILSVITTQLLSWFLHVRNSKSAASNKQTNKTTQLSHSSRLFLLLLLLLPFSYWDMHLRPSPKLFML